LNTQTLTICEYHGTVQEYDPMGQKRWATSSISDPVVPKFRPNNAKSPLA